MCPVTGGLCCSQYGWCGLTYDYCCVYRNKAGCQVGYGRCYGCSSTSIQSIFPEVFQSSDNNFCEKPRTSNEENINKKVA